MGDFKFLVALWLGKTIFFIIDKLRLGAGSTWPGHLAIFLEKSFIKMALKKNSCLKVIIVCGTNGKTSTTSMIKHLLEKIGYQCFSNPEGANLLNGIASSLVRNSDIFGKIRAQFAVFEIDEFSLPLVLKEIKPFALLILNLFRDQLDRYGEVNTILSRWELSLKSLTKNTAVIINGDDPQLYYLGKKINNPVFYFGIKKELMKLFDIPHDVDFIFCPKCDTRLKYKKLSYAHLGDFFCPKCLFKRDHKVLDFKKSEINYPLGGLYNQYNTNAVLTFFLKVLKLDLKKVNLLLKSFIPVFGRQEIINFFGRKIMILLSKNPTGFNQSLRFIEEKVKDLNKSYCLCFLLNNQIPDGRDISWIWDVDFNEKIFRKARLTVISGNRAFDMALRLKYENIKLPPLKIIEEIDNLSLFFKDKIKKESTIYVFANYTAMLEIRKSLLGSKFRS